MPDEHGTYAAYQRHIRQRSNPCGPCREASRAYARWYRHRIPGRYIRDLALSKTRHRAMERLAQRFPATFDQYLREERAAEGLLDSLDVS